MEASLKFLFFTSYIKRVPLRRTLILSLDTREFLQQDLYKSKGKVKAKVKAAWAWVGAGVETGAGAARQVVVSSAYLTLVVCAFSNEQLSQHLPAGCQSATDPSSLIDVSMNFGSGAVQNI